MCFISVSKGIECGKQQGQETFVNLLMNDQQDDKHSHLTIVTSHTLAEVTDTVLGKYRWIKILKELDLVMEIYRRASSCNVEWYVLQIRYG